MTTSPDRILIVDDSSDGRELYRRLLQQRPDSSPVVVEADSGGKGLQLCQSEPPDCLLLRNGLSDIAAVDFLEHLKQANLAGIPVVILTDERNEADAILATQHGAQAYLVTSTVSVDSLHRTIQTAIVIGSLQSRIHDQQRELQLLDDSHRAAERSATPAAAPIAAAPNLQPTSTTTPQSVAATTQLTAVESELEIARHIQMGLLPKGSPLIEGFSIAGLSVPAQAPGGDYHDYLPMADEQLGIVIGDSSGQGLGAALLTASLRAYLRVLSKTYTDPSDIVSRANHFLCDDVGDDGVFTTVFFAILDPRAKSFVYASAGQQGYLINTSGQVDSIRSTGMPLGLRKETIIPGGPQISLLPGDIVLLPSDGLAKNLSPADEKFGIDRMLDIINSNRTLPARMIVSYLHQAALDHAQATTPTDDITIVVIKVDG